MVLTNQPRVVVGATHGRSGKTTITVGLVAALRGLGLSVQPFKKGPDYIDPGWLGLAADRPCRNLDLFWMQPDTLRGTVVGHGADVAVVEGAMGLFDGVDLDGSASTAEVALALGAPVILVVDATRMTRSAAAVVGGFARFDPRLQIGGVILNQVQGKRHRRLLREAVERYTGIPVLGCVPRMAEVHVPDRHLGLVTYVEHAAAQSFVQTARKLVQENVDLDRFLAIARSARPIECEPPLDVVRPPVVRIGVLRDRCFTFYYPENLEALERAGAVLHFIDSLSDHDVPHLDALYVGGGFPEVFAAQLEANVELRHRLREQIRNGLLTYAECGGLMYLGRRIYSDGKAYSMVGALPYDIVMESKRQGHGYAVAEVLRDSPFFSRGTVVQGHEFHYSRVVNLGRDQVEWAYRLHRGRGIDGEFGGVLGPRFLASYVHIHASVHPEWATNFVDAALGGGKSLDSHGAALEKA